MGEELERFFARLTFLDPFPEYLSEIGESVLVPFLKVEVGIPLVDDQGVFALH
jgi:hypothetical protein